MSGGGAGEALYSELDCIMVNGHMGDPREQTDTSENITFLQVRWRVVITITPLHYWKSYKPEELNLTPTSACKTQLLGLAYTLQQLCNTGSRWRGSLFLTLCQHSHSLDDQTGIKFQHFCHNFDSDLRCYRSTYQYICTCFKFLNIFALIERCRIITVRNSSCRKVMFSQACVKNSVHRRACMVGGRMHGGRGHAWQGVSMGGRGRCAW